MLRLLEVRVVVRVQAAQLRLAVGEVVLVEAGRLGRVGRVAGGAAGTLALAMGGVGVESLAAGLLSRARRTFSLETGLLLGGDCSLLTGVWLLLLVSLRSLGEAGSESPGEQEPAFLLFLSSLLLGAGAGLLVFFRGLYL